jgi:hypothetical protein
MDQSKVEKIQKVLLENPEHHVKLVEALNEIGNKMGEKITPDELFKAIGAQTKGQIGDGSTHSEFWTHYLLK